MQHLRGIHHVAVSVPDIQTARRFYIELLGASEVSAVEWSEGTTLINEIVGLPDCSGRQFIARLGNAYIEVFEYLTPRSPAQPPDRPVNLFGYTHFCLQVDDIHAVYERMLAAGIKFHTAPKHGGGPQSEGADKLGFMATYGRDFFGNVFELIEINAASAIPAL
jgi:catechol 2,3-dioxygenase-like lactoylglutathione lyase family enzyme